MNSFPAQAGQNGRLDAYLVGTCSAMCPPSEVQERLSHRQVHKFERGSSPADSSLFVKKHYRIFDEYNNSPEFVRNKEGIAKSMDRLRVVMDLKDESVANRANYLWDRYRAIAKDMSVQHWMDEFAVMVYEEIGRFLIWADEQLRSPMALQQGQEQFDAVDRFDPVLHLKFLNNVLLSLVEIYDEFHRRKVEWHNEVEFRLCHLILRICAGPLEFAKGLKGIRKELMSEVEDVVRLFMAYFEGDWISFFRDVPQLPWVLRALAGRLAPEVRERALLAISKSMGKRTRPYPASSLMEELCLTAQGLVAFCKAFSLPMQGDTVMLGSPVVHNEAFPKPGFCLGPGIDAPVSHIVAQMPFPVSGVDKVIKSGISAFPSWQDALRQWRTCMRDKKVSEGVAIRICRKTMEGTAWARCNAILDRHGSGYAREARRPSTTFSTGLERAPKPRLEPIPFNLHTVIDTSPEESPSSLPEREPTASTAGHTNPATPPPAPWQTVFRIRHIEPQVAQVPPPAAPRRQPEAQSHFMATRPHERVEEQRPSVEAEQPLEQGAKPPLQAEEQAGVAGQGQGEHLRCLAGRNWSQFIGSWDNLGTAVTEAPPESATSRKRQRERDLWLKEEWLRDREEERCLQEEMEELALQNVLRQPILRLNLRRWRRNVREAIIERREQQRRAVLEEFWNDIPEGYEVEPSHVGALFNMMDPKIPWKEPPLVPKSFPPLHVYEEFMERLVVHPHSSPLDVGGAHKRILKERRSMRQTFKLTVCTGSQPSNDGPLPYPTPAKQWLWCRLSGRQRCSPERMAIDGRKGRVLLDQEGTFVWDCWPRHLGPEDGHLLRDTSGFVFLMDEGEDMAAALGRAEALLELLPQDGLLPPLVVLTLCWELTTAQVRRAVEGRLGERCRGLEVLSLRPALEHIVEDVHISNCVRWAPYLKRKGHRVELPRRQTSKPLTDPLETGVAFVASRCSLL